MRRYSPICGAAWLIAAAACYDDPSPILAANPPPGADEVLSTHQLEAMSFGKAFLGGATTVFDSTESAFSNPAPNLDAAGFERHEEGDEAFGDVLMWRKASVHCFTTRRAKGATSKMVAGDHLKRVK
jgi:hypothetical protein